ncbi:hypothetical protein B0T19DRAFT_213410 [Cercophora scortea]|uniref:Cytochrome b561 domain-containing protein n=1 Tax=Cercophora scortea TaxID=314031 RepID=A0AAE0IEK6_9PEZI|nr:hypothetical protein B0T19DRAFT_213410 [Cercophora scortea]
MINVRRPPRTELISFTLACLFCLKGVYLHREPVRQVILTYYLQFTDRAIIYAAQSVPRRGVTWYQQAVRSQTLASPTQTPASLRRPAVDMDSSIGSTPMMSKLLAAFCLGTLLFPPLAHAQYGPPGTYGGGGGFGGGGFGNGNGDRPPGFGSGTGSGAGFDITTATYYRTAHGIVASLAIVLLFPIGSILMRILPGRLALYTHALFQLIALAVFIAGAALGIYLTQIVQLPFGGGSLLTNSATSYHPIIGLVVLAFLLLQPLLGVVHHRVFKRVQTRQVWSYLHIFNGRVVITLGIVNGGLGFHLAGASADRVRVYIIVAAIVWSLWMLVAFWSEVRRARGGRLTERAMERRYAKTRHGRDGGRTTRRRRSIRRETSREGSSPGGSTRRSVYR